MSRLFNGTSDQLTRAGGILSNEPVTLACWFYCTDTAPAATQTLICLGNGGANNGQYQLAILTGPGAVRALKQTDLGVNGSASSTANWSANTWQHASATFTSDTSRAAYLNGTNKGTNATSVGDPSPDFATVGSTRVLSSSNWFKGLLAYGGVWQAALSDADNALLAKGLHPRKVRPDALLACWPIWGFHSPEISIGSRGWTGSTTNFELTVTGTSRGSHDAPVIPYAAPFLRGSVPVIDQGAFPWRRRSPAPALYAR